MARVNGHETGLSKEGDHFLLSSEIRGLPCLKKYWAPKTGDEVYAIPELENPSGRHAVVFTSSKMGK